MTAVRVCTVDDHIHEWVSAVVEYGPQILRVTTDREQVTFPLTAVRYVVEAVTP